MTTRAGDRLFLPDDSFRSEAAGRAELIRSLAGRARIAYELASGANPFPSEAPSTPRNPCGDLGVNLSGPPWGSAVRHPIAWLGGRVSSGGSSQGERQVASIDAGLSMPVRIGPWPIYVRPFEAHLPPGWVAPYSRGHIRLFASLGSAGSADLSVSACVGEGYDYDRARNETIAISSTTSTLKELSTAYFDLVPGYNTLWLLLANLDAAGGQQIVVESLAVHQIAKRSH